MASANPMATEGRDARTILIHHRWESLGLLVMVAAALLVPFDPAKVAIFPVPLVVWAVGVAVLLFSEAWGFGDRVVGVGAPVFAYVVGGVVLGLVRARGDLSTLMPEFFAVSGIMFMVGTVGGVCWLAFRLFDPRL